MQAIIGIDAAWTEHEPSGVALVEGAPGAWRVVSAAPSYDAFIEGSRGAPVEWHRSKFAGCWPSINARWPPFLVMRPFHCRRPRTSPR